MGTLEKRPSFFEAFAEDVLDELRAVGVRAIVPWYAIILAMAAGGLSYFVPVEFWRDSWENGHRDVSTAVYSAFVMFNGLLLALSWSAFSKIHEIIGSHNFCFWLSNKKMLHKYIYLIDFVHVWQILALIVSGAALLSLLYNGMPVTAHRTIMALMLWSTAYAVRWAIGAVQVMHDVVWYRAAFERELADEPSGSGIVPFPRSREN